jgi:D-inositol-3-phosphate glycosyltransferase
MKVAMVSEHASPLAALGGADAGGQNVHVAALGKALAEQGAQVVVHTRRETPSIERKVELTANLAVDHVDAGPPREISKDELLPYMGDFAADLHARWSHDRPDVVHAHFWMSGLAALHAARDLDIPVVQTFHALGVVKRRQQGVKDTSPHERKHLEPQVAKDVDRIIATCSDEVWELVRLGADRRHISVIPCGVDLDHFTPDGPALERTPGLKRVVTLCRLVERKGVGNVIEAVASLEDTELLIAGGPPAAQLHEDPLASRLMRVAADLGVADRVHFLGRVERDDIPALLRSADVVACTPWYEPFGIVPLEAMACGIPVVASRVGGHIDTVVDGATGLHVPPRDPQRLALALEELLEQPEKRAQLGAAAARRAAKGYDWRRIAAATREVYARTATLEPALPRHSRAKAEKGASA